MFYEALWVQLYLQVFEIEISNWAMAQFRVQLLLSVAPMVEC